MIVFKKALLLATVATFVAAGSANATPYYFTRITNNGGAALPWNQLYVTVTDATVAGAEFGSVDFTFYNKAVVKSSLTDIFFADGTLLGIANITSHAGVTFAAPAHPGDLPAGNTITPAFVTTAGFSADATIPAQGVDVAEEWVTITFDLINGKSYANTLAALEDGSLRIGLHITAYENGASESFVNTVPDGGMTLMLLGGALVGLGALRRRFEA